MGEGNAWVTLATNDSYSLGALVLAHSLRRVATKHQLVILVTPGVTPIMRERLSSVFSKVITVDVLDSGDAAHLALLARPELGITFTKLHCWTLTDYSKCVFLDADTLILQNCDELFDREELSAAPDVGWPDCFNSGVFVFRPSNETFQSLIKLAKEKGSFDGGDQGLLNQYFSDWARGDISKHLPFLYNVCSTAFYSYLPALKQYGSDMKIIHFIGNAKPWLQSFNWQSRSVSESGHLQAPLQYWWDIFLENVHPTLDVAMPSQDLVVCCGSRAGIAGTLSQLTIGASQQSPAVEEHMRRQGWEAGNIDYMGADAFDNIWAKISQTLSGPAEAPPSQPCPVESAPAPSVIETPATPIPAESPITPVLAPAPSESAPPAVEPVSVPIPEAAPVEAPVADAPMCPLKQVPSEASSAASSDSWEKVAEKPAAPESISSDLSLSGTTPSSVSSSTPSAADPEPQAASEEKRDCEKALTEATDDSVSAPPAQSKPIKEKLVCHLKPAVEAEQLLTPDTENEDAATIAQSIIAREEALSTPTVTSATPPVTCPIVPLCSPVLQNIKDLTVDTSIPETPPVPGPVSLAQIGISPLAEASPAPLEAVKTASPDPKTPIQEETPSLVCNKPKTPTELVEPAVPLSTQTAPLATEQAPEKDAKSEKAPESCEKPKRTPSQKKVSTKVVLPKDTALTKEPVTPTTPTTPVTPSLAKEPKTPTTPTTPVTPSLAKEPKTPTTPTTPAAPSLAKEPKTPTTPTTPVSPVTAVEKDSDAEPAPAPKVKKMVKKVVPKVKSDEAGAVPESDAPVPPPRKKEKKPKETK